MRQVSATKAKAHLSELISEVAHTGRQIVIERRGRPVAALVSVGDLERLGSPNTLQARPAGALALIGGWGDLDDESIEGLVREIYATRDEERGRTVDLEP